MSNSSPFDNLALITEAIHLQSPSVAGQQVIKGGARHTAKEFKTLNRILQIALELGADLPQAEQPESDEDEKRERRRRILQAWTGRAGARHSRTDSGLIQELHDLAVEMGGECKRVSKGPYSRKPKKAMIVKGQDDAPNYRAASTPQRCENCVFFLGDPGRDWCERFEFTADRDYHCDNWQAQTPDEIPGYEARAQIPKKYARINFKPPKDVQTAARRGLAMRRKLGRGGLDRKQASDEGIGSGVQRATNLANGDTLSPDTVRRMVSFFARHEKNKDSQTKSGEPGAGRIAWELWGGDAGRRWANKVNEQMKRADEAGKNKSLFVLARKIANLR